MRADNHSSRTGSHAVHLFHFRMQTERPVVLPLWQRGAMAEHTLRAARIIPLFTVASMQGSRPAMSAPDNSATGTSSTPGAPDKLGGVSANSVFRLAGVGVK